MKIICFCFLVLYTSSALFAQRPVDPTFLHRHLPEIKEKQSSIISSPTAHYKPLFGDGDQNSGIVKGVSRFGEITIDAGGSSSLVSYPREEHLLVVLDGEGFVNYEAEQHKLRKHDFLYLLPGVKHGLSAPEGKPLRGDPDGLQDSSFHALVIPPKMLLANIDDVRKQVVGDHPPSTLYQLMMGDTNSKRDKIAAGHVMKSLFVMEFAPGGTNFPHHHEREEEVYLLLEGEGEMVAGGGTSGIEGRYPVRPGDAYFYRLNTTVGFYNSGAPNAKTARILAVRSSFPFGGK